MPQLLWIWNFAGFHFRLTICKIHTQKKSNNKSKGKQTGFEIITNNDNNKGICIQYRLPLLSIWIVCDFSSVKKLFISLLFLKWSDIINSHDVTSHIKYLLVYKRIVCLILYYPPRQFCYLTLKRKSTTSCFKIIN